MKKIILLITIMIITNHVQADEQVKLTDYEPKQETIIYPASNHQYSHNIETGCNSNENTKRLSHLYSSGIEKKALDADWKKYKFESSLKKSITHNTDGSITETVEPTEYTREAYRLEELQYERNGDSIKNGLGQALLLIFGLSKF